MADSIEPISHLEKVITGQESPISHLEKVIAQYGVDSDSLTELNNKIEALKTSQSLEYEGTDVTCENTLTSRTSDMLIKGQTYHSSITGIESAGEKENKISILSHNGNLFDGDNTMELGAWSSVGNKVNSSSEIRCKNNFTPLPKSVDRSKGFYLIVSDTSYNNDGNIHLYDKDKKRITTLYDGEEFINGVKFIPPSKLAGVYYFSFRLKSSDTSCTWGIFEKPSNDVILYKQDKKEILLPIEGGLKSLPNGVCDTIEQRNDEVYLVQRVKKETYVVGDENNNNYLTDKVNTYKPLATSIETKLDIKNLDLEVYKDITYIATDNAIQPTLSFKVPSNIGGIIQANAQNINKLYKLIDEVIIPQLINNSADIEILKLK